MKPKKALKQLIKCSGAKTVKAASGKWHLAAFFNLAEKVCPDAFVICKDVGIKNVS